VHVARTSGHLASAASAAAPGFWLLVGFRTLQAAGAALLTPTSLGLLLHAMPAARRARAVRVWAATGALAAAAGPVVGGLLVAASWRWVFLVNVPVGLLALSFAARVVPESRDAEPGRLPDLPGAGLLALAVGSVALGLVEAPSWGRLSLRTWGAIALAALSMAWFCRRSLQHASPVVEPALLRVRAFAWSNATALVFGVAFAGNLLVNILWMQQVWHYTALRTGLGVAPGPLMVPIFAAVAQSVAHRVSVGWIAAAGCLLLGSGLALSVFLLGPDPSYAAEMLPARSSAARGRPGAAHHLVRRHDRPPAGPRRDRQRHRQHEPAGRHRLGRQRPGGPARDPCGIPSGTRRLQRRALGLDRRLCAGCGLSDRDDATWGRGGVDTGAPHCLCAGDDAAGGLTRGRRRSTGTRC